LIKPDTIILASGSPRRKQLLTEAGIFFTVRTKPTDESFPEDMNVYQVAEFLARKKAAAFLDELACDQLIIAADTVVIHNNEILGKPSSPEEAFHMLKRLSGQTHEVITGVCLLGKNHEEHFSDRTTVSFRILSDKQINYYLSGYNPYDKAGSYGIQEWIGLIGVEKITGSYFNVMGLPVHLIYESLRKLQPEIYP